MLIILDYGMGNPASILNMVKKAGGEAVVSSDIDAISKATAIILPGVGSFDNGMKRLEDLEITQILHKKVIQNKTPFLGVCLGMQLLFESSEEGQSEGLCWVSGKVKRFDFSEDVKAKQLKIPHMGWNVINPVCNQSMFGSKDEEQRFYFVHSYHVVCDNQEDVLATVQYGDEFTCAIKKENICGVQFHPEKSHRFGMNFFSKYLKEINCA
jgi:imidazole glycerol-phosphate synthase subunit HisH